MAVTNTAINSETAGWKVNSVSADYSGCEELKAAVASNNHYIDHITVSTGSNINVTIGAGETGGAVTATILGPLYFPANGGTYKHTFKPAIKVAANTAITADASGAGATTIFIEGRTK